MKPMLNINPLFKKGIQAETKNYASVSPSSLISKVIVKQFIIKSRIIIKEMNYSKSLVNHLKQNVPQICLCWLIDMVLRDDGNGLGREWTGMVFYRDLY